MVLLREELCDRSVLLLDKGYGFEENVRLHVCYSLVKHFLDLAHFLAQESGLFLKTESS